MKNLDVKIFTVLGALTTVLLIAYSARSSVDTDNGCVKALVTEKYLVFANVCQPTHSYSLPIRAIQLSINTQLERLH